jgi:hypothetical protein
MTTEKRCAITLILLLTVVLAAAGCGGTAGARKAYRTSLAVVCPSFARPASPGPMSATANDGSVALVWTLSPEAKSLPLTLYRWQAGGVPAVLVALPAGQTTYSDKGLTNGTRYFYLLVTAPKGKVTSACSSTAFAIPTPPPPPPVVESSAYIAESGSSQLAGRQRQVHIITCGLCGGSGVVRMRRVNPFEDPIEEPCPHCHGTGQLQFVY